MSKHKQFIPVAAPDLTGNERRYVCDCLDSTWISSKGKFIDSFEKSFAEYIGTDYAVSVSNGTAALHLALVSLGIGKGDEILVPDLTFISCANAVSYTGAVPVFVDVDKTTWNIDPAQIENKITSHTKAIMAVHSYGHPANMDKIMQVADKYNLKIIEDAAEAHGAEIRINNPITQSFLPGRQAGKNPINNTRREWKKVGSIGELGCFSFYGNKIITTGEGGMVVTNHKNLAKKIRILRDHGQEPDKRYFYKTIGFNYRMTNMQAAVGLAQMERIDHFLEKKRWIAHTYNKLLKNIPGIILPPHEPWARTVYWMYSILTDRPFKYNRDELMKKLSLENIETRPFFYPLHKLLPYKSKHKYVKSEFLSIHGINLPSSVNLTIRDINRIVKTIIS